VLEFHFSRSQLAAPFNQTRREKPSWNLACESLSVRNAHMGIEACCVLRGKGRSRQREKLEHDRGARRHLLEAEKWLLQHRHRVLAFLLETLDLALCARHLFPGTK
jgi:hypothetical protein